MFKIIIDTLRYKKESYPFLFFLLFACSIFENFKLGENFVLSDLLYCLFIVVFCFKLVSVRFHSNENFFLYPIVFLLIATFDYGLFHNSKMFMSQLRFVFNCSVFAILATYFIRQNFTIKEKLISTYTYVCVICSCFIIIQFISFYVFRYNLAFDFGSYQGSINHASLETPSLSAIYRTGGFFKEPSWYAVFMGPVLDITYKRKQIPQLIICILGLIFSTSSMGFLFLFFFVAINLKSNKKYLFLFLAAFIVLYFIVPMAFTRLFEAMNTQDGDNSNNSRVILPFTLVWEHGQFPLFGLDIAILYDLEDSLFLNTFLFVVTSFGIVGFVFFMRMILNKGFPLLNMILIATVVIEGCYGRIDFWMPLLAATIFCKTYKTHTIINNKI